MLEGRVPGGRMPVKGFPGRGAQGRMPGGRMPGSGWVGGARGMAGRPPGRRLRRQKPDVAAEAPCNPLTWRGRGRGEGGECAGPDPPEETGLRPLPGGAGGPGGGRARGGAVAWRPSEQDGVWETG